MRRVLIAAAAFYAVFIARSALVIHGAVYSTLFDDAMVSTRTLIESDAIAGGAAAFTGFGYALVFWTLRGAALDW